MQKIKPKKIHAIDDEIDFKAIWISINESKRLIIIVSLAFAIVSAIFLFLRPTYVSSTTIELGSYKMESTACENYSNLFKSYYHRSVRGFMSSENTQPIVWGSCNQGAVAKDGFIHNYSELIGLL